MRTQSIYQALVSGNTKLAVVGLGYVGLPVAIEFARHIQVIGFDIDPKRINAYRNGVDLTNSVGKEIQSTVQFVQNSELKRKPALMHLKLLAGSRADAKKSRQTVIFQ